MTKTELIVRNTLFQWNKENEMEFNWLSPDDITDSDLQSILEEELIIKVHEYPDINLETDCNKWINTYRIDLDSGSVYIETWLYKETFPPKDCIENRIIKLSEVKIAKEMEEMVKRTYYINMTEEEL